MASVTVLLVAAAVAVPKPAGPIAPTGPLPPVALAVAPNPARSPRCPTGIHINVCVRPMTRAECARTAVAAMAADDRFRFAEVGPDGNARGYSDGVTAIVLTSDHVDGVVVTTVTAGWDSLEAERTRDALVKRLMAGPAPKGAPERVADKAPPSAERGPPIRWHVEPRPALKLMRLFVPAAEIAFEKYGLSAGNSNSAFVYGAFGGGPDRLAMAFHTPGTNGLACRVGVVVASADPDLADRTARNLLASLVGILFE